MINAHKFWCIDDAHMCGIAIYKRQRVGNARPLLSTKSYVSWAS